jgi:CheY-like chemotaxis protein
MSRILIIDDEEPIRKLLRSILEQAGHTVLDAANGREGMALWHKTPADVVVTDIFMPDKDGIQILTELRRVATRPKIIAMTGGESRGLFDFKPAARLLGADRVLSKPFEVRTFLLTVEEVLKSMPGSRGVSIGSGIEEQRKYPRFSVSLSVSISDGLSTQTGMVADISREGCRIQCANAVPSEKYFQVEIQPETPGERLTVDLAVMRWSRERELGIEFIRMAPESKAQLRHILQTCEETCSQSRS